MPVGGMMLMIAAVLVYCGLLQRVLDRIRLTDRQALLLIGAMLIGTFLPSIVIGAVSINIGGAMIPVGICIYLLTKADDSSERWRGIVGAALTGAAVYMLSRFLPSEPEKLLFDPVWIYGLSAGLFAWLIGRSRRAAFIGGVLGILIADVVNAIIIYLRGYQTQLYLGGGGIADATVISGVAAVLICELFGELAERISRKCYAERRRYE